MSKDNLYGSLAALASNVIFGFSFLFSSSALAVAHPLVILSVRFTIAFLFMSLLVLCRVVKVNYRGKKLRGILLMALMQPLAYFLLEIYGIKYTTSALSGIVISLVPVAAALLSITVLREKPTVKQTVCIAVSFAGIAAISMLSENTGKNYVYGVVLLVLAVVCAALFNMFSRREAAVFSAAERTYFMFLVAAVGFNLIALCVFRGGYVSAVARALSHKQFVISMIYLAVVSSCLTFLLYNYATAKISIIRSCAFSNVLTVVSVLAGVIILKEEFSVLQLILCVPVLAGVFGVNLYGK